MYPKEKAKELYDTMETSILELEGDVWYRSANVCAIVAVNEILEILTNQLDYKMEKSIEFYSLVKEELISHER